MTAVNQPATCPICKKEAVLVATDDHDDLKLYQCSRCGNFRLNTWPPLDVRTLEEKGYIISGYVRSRNRAGVLPVILISEIIEEIFKSYPYPQTVVEKMDMILIHIADKQQVPGPGILLDLANDYTLAFAKDDTEFVYLLTFLHEEGFLTDHPRYSLTLNGWRKVEELKRAPSKVDQAFVAMWYGKADGVDRVDEMKQVYEMGIRRAIEKDNPSPEIKAVRIDLVEHNDPIDSRILVEIRKSRFMVADFTGHRGGVYFEAGYALAHKIPVIWTCKKDEADKMHFDTRQFSRIEWENENDLYEKLKRRIEGSIF